MSKKINIDCNICKSQSTCCMTGAWVDLDEAKKILSLKIKGGDFFHMEKDSAYPSGYCTSTSIGFNPCTFLTRKGLCKVHMIDYGLKPMHCKEFPYEKGKISPVAKYLCPSAKRKKKK